MSERSREAELLRKRGDAASAFVVTFHCAFALAPLYVGAVVGPGWWLAPLTLWFGVGMNSLLNLMHECSHYHVFTSKRACTLFGRWVLGPLALADFDSYRQRHWDHHRNLGTDGDPKYIYRTSIDGWRSVLLLLKCLALVEPVQRFAATMAAGPRLTGASDPPAAPPSDRRWIVRTIVFHAVLTLSLLGVALAWRPRDLFAAAVDTAIVYMVVYVYGLAAVTVFFASLRAIAEHQIGADDAPSQHDAALRNLRVNPITRWMFGAYGFADHYTHHIKPAIPYYRLPEATRALAASDASLTPRHSYVSTLWRLIRSRNAV